MIELWQRCPKSERYDDGGRPEWHCACHGTGWMETLMPLDGPWFREAVGRMLERRLGVWADPSEETVAMLKEDCAALLRVAFGEELRWA